MCFTPLRSVLGWVLALKSLVWVGVKVVDLGVGLWGLSSTPQSAVLVWKWLIWGLNCGVWVQPPNQQFGCESGWFGGWTVGSEFNPPISSFGVKVIDLGVELWGLSSTPQSAVLVWKWLIWGLNCGVWVQPPNQQFWCESDWFGGWTVGSEFNPPISSFGVKVIDLGVELWGLSSTPQSAVLVWKWLIWGLNCGVWVQPPNQQFWCESDWFGGWTVGSEFNPPISSFGVKVIDLGVELWGLSSTPQSAVLVWKWLIWGLNCGVWVQPPNQQFWCESDWFGGWTVGSEFNPPISSFGVKVVDLGVELWGLSSTPQSAVLVWKWLIWGLNCGVWVQPPNQQFWCESDWFGGWTVGSGFNPPISSSGVKVIDLGVELWGLSSTLQSAVLVWKW